MRKRPWIVAALSLACGLMLPVLGAPISLVSPRASETPAGSGPPSSHTTATTRIRTAGEPTTTGSGNWSAQPEPPAGNPPAVVLDSSNVRGILGSAVRSATDEDMGRIVDVIVDRAGITRAAVIDFGGFLGVGSRKIAIDWNAMRFTGLSRVTLDMTRDQVKAAPQYQAGKPIVVLGASPEFARSHLTERMPER
jgi:hypothetical protein